MNCSDIQELLPLYAGRDLEEKRGQLVTAHLQACPACARSAGEYRESRQLLQQFAPPSFNDEVYDEIRRGVWREIAREQEAAAPTLPQIIASLFRPRLKWAVATALVLAVSIVSVYFFARHRNGRRDERQSARSGERTDRPASPSIEESPPLNRKPVQKRGPVQAPEGPTHQTAPRKRLVTAPDRRSSLAVNKPNFPSMPPKADRESNEEVAMGAITLPSSARAEKTLRVELQTRDPNIRIIWFAHQPAKQDSPNKTF